MKNKQCLKRNFKGLVAVFLTIILLGLSIGISYISNNDILASALTISDDSLKSISILADDNQNYIKYSEKIREVDGFANKTILDIKFIKDFNGNLYVDVECNPCGYLIFDYDTDTLLEFSEDSVSPYQGYNGELIYGGPTHYFIEHASYKHTANVFYTIDLMTNKTTELSKDTFNAYKTNNSEIRKKIVEKTSKNNNLTENKNLNISPNASTITNGDWSHTYIDNYTYISQCTSFGYNSQGTCGYIAAGLLLYYAYRQYNTAFIDSQYITSNGFTDSFHWYLVNLGVSLGLKYDTWAADIDPLMNKYLKNRVPTATHNYTLLADRKRNVISIAANNPFILFGNFIDVRKPGQNLKINHAITAFGYSTYNPNIFVNDFYFKVHYGYNGYTNVSLLDSIFTNPIGSVFYLQSHK